MASLVLAPLRAEAQARQLVDLQYEVDPSLRDCPNATEFGALVSRKLGYDPRRSGSELGLRVQLARSDGGISGTIEWSTGGSAPVGRRQFSSRSEDCRDISLTMGFVVAVQLQMRAAELPPEPASSDRAAPLSSVDDSSPSEASARDRRTQSRVARSSVPRVEVTETRDATPTPVASVGGGPSVGFGFGPEPTLLGRLHLALEQSGRSMELGALASLPGTARRSSASFRYQVVLGTMAACGHLAALFGCGLANLGVLRVRGIDVDRPVAQQGFVVQAGLRVGYRLGLTDSLHALARLDGFYLLTPWVVELNHQRVWSMPRLSAATGIDLAYRFR